jgi:hypothetical protein
MYSIMLKYAAKNGDQHSIETILKQMHVNIGNPKVTKVRQSSITLAWDFQQKLRNRFDHQEYP